MPVNESNTIQYTVTTTNTADGTTLYWKTTGNTTNSDIVGGNTGSITITNNQAIFNVTVAADSSTDGTKTLGIALVTGSQDGPTVVTTSSPIIVNDTSITPTYSVTANTATVDEGGTVTFTITTSVNDGTTLYWTNSGNTSAADFVDSSNSGSFIISGGIGTVSRTLLNDVTTEGSENIVFEVRTVSTSGTIVASNTVIVNDTSQAPSTVSADYLVVAGGGTGGTGNRSAEPPLYGGGGGAGGVRYGSTELTFSTLYTVTVGGAGSNSSFNSIESTRGGNGGSAPSNVNPTTGGSGGGGPNAFASDYVLGAAGNTPTTSPSQGNNGGKGGRNSFSVNPRSFAAGGGGGASQVGGEPDNGANNGSSGGLGGRGGNGYTWLNGITYGGGGGGAGASASGGFGSPSGIGGTGGGGGGGSGSSGTQVYPGETNTGGGGGGGWGNNSGQNGQSGGSGIIIIRCVDSITASSTTGSPTVTTSGGYRYYRFTSSGTITF
jgi:hypothetical protein